MQIEKRFLTPPPHPKKKKIKNQIVFKLHSLTIKIQAAFNTQI